MTGQGPGIRMERVGAVAVFVFSRPMIRNAVSHAMLDQMVHLMHEAEADASVRAILIRAEGRDFCSGLDLGPLRGVEDPLPYMEGVLDRLNKAVLELYRVPVPVIAELKGMVLGAGLGLAIACDVRIASSDLKMAPGYYARGLSMAGAMSLSLPKIIGLQRAREMALLGRQLTAADAREWGLVNRVVEMEELPAAAMDAARTAAAGPTQAQRRTKRLLMKGHLKELEDALDREREFFLECIDTKDFRENLRRFFSKEPTVFTGE